VRVGRHKEERRERRVVVSWNRERGGRVIMKRGVIIEATRWEVSGGRMKMEKKWGGGGSG